MTTHTLSPPNPSSRFPSSPTGQPSYPPSSPFSSQQSFPQPSQALLSAITDQSGSNLRTYLNRLIQQLKNPTDSPSPSFSTFLHETMTGLAYLLRDGNTHPKVKYQSHKIIMYLILMADLDVYEEFLTTVYPILRGNCMYNKGVGVNMRGEDFFKNSKFFTDPTVTAAQKNQIKKYGCLYIIFCLQTVQQIAKWLPFDLDDDTKPTKFWTSYENLLKQGVTFPTEDQYQFYNNHSVEQIQKVIRQIEKKYESILGPSNSQPRSSIGQLRMGSGGTGMGGGIGTGQSFNSPEMKKNRISGNMSGTGVTPGILSFVGVGSGGHLPMQKKSNQSRISSRIQSKMGQMQIKTKISQLEQQKNKLLKQIQLQRNFYQQQLNRQKQTHQQNTIRYQKKILSLEQQIDRLKQKIFQLQTRNSLNNQFDLKLIVNNFQMEKMKDKDKDKEKDRKIEQLNSINQTLNFRVKRLQQQISNMELQHRVGGNIGDNNSLSHSKSASVLSTELEKLKKQNKSLKTKLLTQFSEYSEFSTKRSSRAQNTYPEKMLDKGAQLGKFLTSDDARSNFQPFYSNSPTELKTRLKKSILRQKQLLYRDKILQIGCITKPQPSTSLSSPSLSTSSPLSLKLTLVFTNISDRPIHSFTPEFISRQDLVIKVVQPAKNYIEISGQIKMEMVVLVRQIDFRCVLCSVQFGVGGRDGRDEEKMEKIAVILPISRLKLMKQQVYTPANPQKLQKHQLLIPPQQKILPNLHKFKQYFVYSVLEVDRLGHECYLMKVTFAGVKMYIQCDEIQGQLRIGIMYGKKQDLGKVEKLGEQFCFLFGRG